MRGERRPILRCPYCGREAVLATGAALYPHRPDLAGVHVWTCAPCDARVGCHPGTRIPLGGLANAELRRARVEAHEAFDVRWARSGALVRGGWKPRRCDAYVWLSEQLGIPFEECHMGQFDLETCRKVVELCRRGKP